MSLVISVLTLMLASCAETSKGRVHNEACPTAFPVMAGNSVCQIFWGPLGQKGSIHLVEGLRILFLVYKCHVISYILHCH